MIRDSEFSDDRLAKFIQSDSVGRNKYLNIFITALNSVNQNTYISIDANWGAGKTVFMKQLEYVNYCPLDMFNAPSLDIDTLKDFQDKYAVFYYNAWENDYHDDALQSLLFSLIDRFYSDEKRKDKVKSLTKTAVKSIATEAVKTLTSGIVDIEKISSAETVDDLVGNIRAVNERKQAISDIIGKILPDGKKLLFIIDELDRCNPEFAVRLMEVAKHYYNDDNMVFVLSTNNRQLVHTVQKYYGNNFDGYGYLDKMYDLILELPKVDIKQYFQSQLGVRNDSYWINIVPIEMAQYLDLTMREANRYYSLLSFIKGRLTGGGTFDNNTVNALTHFVFIPLAIALKVRDIKLYDEFIAGDGERLIRKLYKSNEVISRIRTNDTDQNQNAVDVAVDTYKAIINSNNIPYDQANYHIIQAGDFFREILPLIASVSEIDKPGPDTQA